MAFADPLAITIDGTAHTLPRVFKTAGVGDFNSENGNVSLVIRPTITRANRDHRIIQMQVAKNVTDPSTSLSTRVSSTVSVVVDSPIAGYTDDELVKAAVGLLTFLTAGTNANLKKLVGGEN